MSSRAELSRASLTPALHNAIVANLKGLAIDAIEKSNSGHPGMPLGAADFATVLWSHFLIHDPADPAWMNRDRFVLSAGHGSMLLYGLLHLTGYDLPIEELQRFRQWDSKTPGHPEYGHTVGVEVTTGPLGTGFATGIGLAIGERFMAARYNRPNHEIIDHFTYGIVSDGDLMEGVAAEAASLAGHLALGKIIYLYDDNKITIDGSTDVSFNEDVGARFVAYGWHVEKVDGHDPAAIRAAIDKARAERSKPSLICCRTVIGKSAPTKAGSSGCHGAPLGAKEALATRAALGLPADQLFYVSNDVDAWRSSSKRELAKIHQAWDERYAAYRGSYPELAAELESLRSGKLPADLFTDLPRYEIGQSFATRDVGHKVLNALAVRHPTLLGGSADLASSNKVGLANTGIQSADDALGRNIAFGVREHAMSAICNGLALYGGARSFCATFLIFSDFMRGGIRLSSLMKLPVVYVLTHDSFWVGEDGPTHQPIEQLASLRAMPGLHVVRPADARETVGAWKFAMQRTNGPTALCLTRQAVPVLASSKDSIEQGAYVVWQGEGVDDRSLDGIMIATGSEVAASIAAAQELAAERIHVRVVSMPCWEAFATQSEAYREEVLPARLQKRLSIEAGSTFGWSRYASAHQGIDDFGASAPGEELARRFGFNAEAIAARYRSL